MIKVGGTWVKRLALIIFLSLVVLIGAGEARVELVDRIVAVVNNEIITLGEFTAAFEPIRQRIAADQAADKERIVEQARRDFLERMINEMLIEQEARKSALTVKDDEVMGAIRDMLTKRNLTLEMFRGNLAAQGVSFDDYKKNVKAQLTRMKLIRREIKAKVIVTPEEIGEYYRRHRDDYEGVEAVRIKQILVPVPRGAQARLVEGLRREAEEIYQRISKGESFDGLLALYARQGKVTGGDLGFLEKGVMHAEVEEVAFGLRLNEVSEVIESPAGFHIIMVVDRRGAGIKPLTEVREEIRARVEEEKMEKRFEEWLHGLRKKSYIDIRL